LAWSSPAGAQTDYTYRLAVLGGLGGPADSDRDKDFDHEAFQIEVGMVTNQSTLATVRLGKIDLDGGEPYEGLDHAELKFANIAGEYRFDQGYYDFGMYLGLGGYKIDGDPVPGAADAQTAIGIVFGINGDFDLTRHLAITAGASAHYIFFDKRSNLYANALAGVAFRF
jgi:hypothetical protein